MARIALDAMGGDHAPGEIVAGAAVAAAHGVEVVLVGDSAQLRPLSEEHGFGGEIVEAAEVVEMGDDPGRAIREKPDSSVAVAARLVREGKVDGFVSAGSTGAAMASAAIIVGRIEGVLRPTIASIFPTPANPTVMLDSGANPEVKPEHLLQFAEMGAAMAEIYFDADRARVGLLNIGEEKSKGRPLDKATYELLERSALNFIGNVEGRDIATGVADVIVTDGFTGNVFLKTVEGAAALITQLILQEVSELEPDLQQALMPALMAIKDRLDYESVGGAHLIGAKGVVVIAHGSSRRRAIANAVQMAADGAERGLVQRVRELHHRLMQDFFARLGYEFDDAALLEKALTHRSWTAENPNGEHNERMEFLGDAVLQLSVTQYLYENFPDLSEGQMAKVRASCVSGAQLAEVANELGLGGLVRMGTGEAASGGRKKQSILADAMEAVLAAVYLDSDIQRARSVVLGHWAKIVDDKAKDPGRRDYKTRYQEVLASRGLRPEYDVHGSGPDHKKHFVATLKVDGEVVGVGEGRSKKEAQQAAARAALGE